MKYGFSLVMVVFAGVTALAQQSDAGFQWAVKASGVTFHANITYHRANGRDLKLDVITSGPASEPKPTLLYIYGGGWVNGTKESTTFASLPYIYKGMNAVHIDYQLAGDSLAPAAVEDCRCALRWVFRHAREYGFDTSKIVVAGESAGGHLALMTGMLNNNSEFDKRCIEEGDGSIWVAAIVSYSGPTDVADLLEGPNQKWFAQQWFGSQPNRIDLARQLSPVTYVRPGLPIIIQVHGDQDPHVPYQQARYLHELLDKAGDTNQLITLHGPIHGWAVEKELHVEEQVFNWLEKYGIVSH